MGLGASPIEDGADATTTGGAIVGKMESLDGSAELVFGGAGSRPVAADCEEGRPRSIGRGPIPGDNALMGAIGLDVSVPIGGEAIGLIWMVWPKEDEGCDSAFGAGTAVGRDRSTGMAAVSFGRARSWAPAA